MHALKAIKETEEASHHGDVNLQNRCKQSAQSKLLRGLTFLYESSIVGSYFSTKIPCTN